MKLFFQNYGVFIGLAILSELLSLADFKFWGLIAGILGLLALANILKEPIAKFFKYMNKNC